MNKNVTTQHCP